MHTVGKSVLSSRICPRTKEIAFSAALTLYLALWALCMEKPTVQVCVGPASVASAGGEFLIARFRVEHILHCQHHRKRLYVAWRACPHLLTPRGSAYCHRLTHCQGTFHITPKDSCKNLKFRPLLPAQGLFSRVQLSCLCLKFDEAERAVLLLGQAAGGAVDWGTALQPGRSRVRFPMVSLEIFIDIILPVALWPWGWLSL